MLVRKVRTAAKCHSMFTFSACKVSLNNYTARSLFLFGVSVQYALHSVAIAMPCTNPAQNMTQPRLAVLWKRSGRRLTRTTTHTGNEFARMQIKSPPPPSSVAGMHAAHYGNASGQYQPRTAVISDTRWLKLHPKMDVFVEIRCVRSDRAITLDILGTRIGE